MAEATPIFDALSNRYGVAAHPAPIADQPAGQTADEPTGEPPPATAGTPVRPDPRWQPVSGTLPPTREPPAEAAPESQTDNHAAEE